ncbi:MAG: two-component system sensor histidine kinase/response regulator [Akkermansiaceae bacterium]|nr:two-component system sensor histidine kinase/response regulator [Akkermansiaceae bacterium]
MDDSVSTPPFSETPASPDWEEALERCAAAPIHLIGQVQDGIALIAIDIAADRFTHLSATAGSWLWADTPQLWKASPADIFGRTQLDLLFRRASSWRGRGPRMIEVEFGSGFLQSCWVHRSGELLVIECILDPLEFTGESLHTADWDDAMDFSFTRMDTEGDLSGKLTVAARETRALGQFDRVMIYRFLPDGTGEVVAEDVREDWEPFLGLRYPASDVPAQARALFLKNDMRLIRDTASTPVAILAAPGLEPERRELDLSLARYRQSAAVHVEYLKNMAVTGSFVTAINVDNQLWGLISCHQGAPLRLPPARQAQLLALTSHLAEDLAGIAREHALREQLASSRLENKLIQCVTLTDDWTSVLMSMAPDLMKIMGSDGLSLRFQGQTLSAGVTPPDETVSVLASHALTRGITQPLSSSHAASYEIEPAFQAEIGGFLLIPLSHFCDDALIFFRREQTQKIIWGGNPAKAVDRSEGFPQLRPRASFAAWQEIVRGGCDQWENHTKTTAASMGTTLSDIVITTHFFRQWMESPSTARHRLAHETNPEPVALTDEQGIVVFQNAAATRDPILAGLQALDRLAASVPALDTPEGREAIRLLANEGTTLKCDLTAPQEGVLEVSRLTEEGRVIGYVVRVTGR